MPRTVILHHVLPDGTSHYDWMLERSPPARGLLTFRVFVRPDDEGCCRFEADRIADHRPEYLTYEGPVSGDRGTVCRVASGVYHPRSPGERGLDLEVRFGATSRRWRGRRLGDGSCWSFDLADGA